MHSLASKTNKSLIQLPRQALLYIRGARQFSDKSRLLILPPNCHINFQRHAEKHMTDPNDLAVDVPQYSDRMAGYIELSLPNDVLERIKEISNNGILFQRIKNLPRKNDAPGKSFLLGFTRLLGHEAIRDFTENHGASSSTVMPREGKEHTETGMGAKAFPWHIDKSYLLQGRMYEGHHEQRHWLTMLNTIVGKEDTITGFLHVDDIANAVKQQDPHAYHMACEPLYIFKKEANLPAQERNGQIISQGSIFSRDERTGKLCLDWYSGAGKMEGTTREADEVIKKMRKIISSLPSLKLTLKEPGDGVAWVNPNFAHSRLNEISQPLPGERRRELQRIYANPVSTQCGHGEMDSASTTPPTAASVSHSDQRKDNSLQAGGEQSPNPITSWHPGKSSCYRQAGDFSKNSPGR